MKTLIKEGPASDLQIKIDKAIGELNVISKSDSQKIFKIETPCEHRFFPKKALKELADDPSDDYFIIYLTGISIKEQRKRFTAISFYTRELYPDYLELEGRSGYFLIKMMKDDLAGLNDIQTEGLDALSANWRRANAREACEIMLLLSQDDWHKKHLYLKEWHLCPAAKIKDRNRSALVKINPGKNKVIFQNRFSENIPSNVNSIIIRKST